MRIKAAFEKLKNIFKSKPAVRIIAVTAVVLAIGAIILSAVLLSGDKGPDTYTIVFESNGGSSVASQSVCSGEKVTPPAPPTREGYVFGGWYVHGIPWSFDINTVREDTVMRAVWLEAVAVTFDTGEEIHTALVAKDTKIRESDVPNTHRDDLCGWFVGGVKWDFETPVTEPVRLNVGYYSSLGISGDVPESFDSLFVDIGVEITHTEHGELALGAIGESDVSELVNLLDYSEYLPNFTAFLDSNPSIYEALLSQGGVYYAPKPVPRGTYSCYINEEWVTLLLDSENVSGNSHLISNMLCVPIVSDDKPVVSLNAESYITKRLDVAGNILYTMNRYNSIGGLNGSDALNYLKGYIDRAYSGYYAGARSELFVGNFAAYDTDELTALLRVAVANPSELGKSGIFGIYVDAEDTAVVASLIASLYGVENIDLCITDFAISDGKVCYEGKSPAVMAASSAFNRMISEGLVTFDESAPALIRYGDAKCSGGYTKILPPASKRASAEIDGEPAIEYLRLSDTVACDMLYTISVCESALSERERLMSALRVVDYLYSK